MKTELNYGSLNPHVIGIAIKEIVRRAIEDIWKNRIEFESHNKEVDYKPDKNDVFTSADLASQNIFVRKITECFPFFGIVAEEEGFTKKCQMPNGNLFFTIDPLDGTKAFARRQSGGFGPMVSLCSDEEVIAAYVGDAMTKELYYYRPESQKTHRLNFGDGQCEKLLIVPDKPLKDQYVLLRDNPLDIPEPYRTLAQSVQHNGLFKDIEVQGGGIGTGMARLWKGEVGGYVIRSGYQAPWDLMPVWGMSKKLGFEWLYFDQSEKKWRMRSISPTDQKLYLKEATIIVHNTRVGEFFKGTQTFS